MADIIDIGNVPLQTGGGMFWPAVGMIGAGAIAGAASYGGSVKANKMSQKIAQQQMQFQAAQTSQQMGFQERMSNTAYQRAMADMEAAGLNPILAYSQGGASSPAGAAASGAGAQAQNELGPAVSSAIDAIRSRAEIKNLQVQNKNIESQVEVNSALAAKTRAEADVIPVDMYRKLFGTGTELLDFLRRRAGGK